MDRLLCEIEPARDASWTVGRLAALARMVGFTSLAAGALTGMLIGLWSFGGPVPTPPAIGDYGDLPRRLLRLGHIAFFGLGMLSLILARHLPSAPLALRAQRGALGCMIFGNLALPPALIAGALLEPLKYLTAPPAFAVTLALCIAALAAWKDFLQSDRKAE